MKARILLPFLFIALFFSCDKDKEPSIDYNVITEQRIIDISEQETITEEDIATLERLNANVTDNSLKAKYTEMIEGVKILKDFIPALNRLRIDPDVIFQDLYAQLEEQLKQVTDQLPRKTKLQKELETALANYNTEEVEFLEVVLRPENGNLARFLAENHDVHPVEGKPYRYLRADIERVDSLVFNANNDYEEGVHFQTLRHFRGLKYLRTNSFRDMVQDLNHLSNLETLDLSITTLGPVGWELKIDQLHNLKHLIVKQTGRGNSPFGEVIDFTNRHPLLESLELPVSITQQLTTLLLPNKQHLKKLVLPYENSNGGNFRRMKRLVVEGNGIQQGHFSFGTPAGYFEVDEVRLSGFGGTSGESNGENSSYFSLSAGGHTVKIKKLSLSNMGAFNNELRDIEVGELSLNNVNFSKEATGNPEYSLHISFLGQAFPQKPDLTWINRLKITILEVTSIDFSNLGKLGTWNYADVSTILSSSSHSESLKELYLAGVWPYPNKTVDLRQLKNIELFASELRDLSNNSTVVLDKVIVNKAVQGRFKLLNGWDYSEAVGVQIEYVD